MKSERVQLACWTIFGTTAAICLCNCGSSSDAISDGDGGSKPTDGMVVDGYGCLVICDKARAAACEHGTGTACLCDTAWHPGCEMEWDAFEQCLASDLALSIVCTLGQTDIKFTSGRCDAQSNALLGCANSPGRHDGGLKD